MNKNIIIYPIILILILSFVLAQEITNGKEQPKEGLKGQYILEGEGYQIILHDPFKIPEVTYDGNILSVESIDMTKAEIKLWHDNNFKGVRLNPVLKVRFEGENDFIPVKPYCLNKTIYEYETINPCMTKDGKIDMKCFLEEKTIQKQVIVETQVEDPDNCFNYVYISQDTYNFSVEHFSEYMITDDKWSNYTSFNDSITNGNFTYYNYSETTNKWVNRSKYIDNLYSWTNVTNATMSIISEDNTDGIIIDYIYTRGTNRGFRGLAFNGTHWFTDTSDISLSSMIYVWDKDWNRVGNITVQAPGGGMDCDYRDLEINPQDPTEIMVLCSETGAGFNWFRWANISTGLQDWSRNWTLPSGFYQAAALTNNYIIAARTTPIPGFFIFNKTDGSLLYNVSTPNDHVYEGGWSNGTHAFFMRGSKSTDNRSYIVCPEENLSQCSEVGWLPPTCETLNPQGESTADFVIENDWFSISWDDRTTNNCENSIDLYYNKDYELSRFRVYGITGLLYALDSYTNLNQELTGMWEFGIGSTSVFTPDTLELHNGTVSGATYGASSGIIGGAYTFDGINDYISIPDSDRWDFANKSITITLWFKNVGMQTANFSTFLDHHIGGVASGWRYGYALNSTYVRFVNEGNGSENSCVLQSPSAITDNEWHFTSVILNYSEKKCYLWMDGILIDDDDYDNLTDRDQLLYVGGRGIENGFNGIIDEIRIYNRTLEPLDIISLYNKQGSIDLDFSQDLIYFIANNCSPDTSFLCDPYELRFEGLEGIARYDDIYYRITTGFSTLQECLDTYNGTQNCCFLNRDNYYEQIDNSTMYYLGDSTCAVRLAGNNVTIDFNDALFEPIVPGTGIAIYSFRDASNLTAYNIYVYNYDIAMYIDMFDNSNFLFENMTIINGESYFLNSNNTRIHSLLSFDFNRINSYPLIFSEGVDIDASKIFVIEAYPNITRSLVYIDSVEDSMFSNFYVNSTRKNVNGLLFDGVIDNNIFTDWNIEVDDGVGISASEGIINSLFTNINISNPSNGMKLSGYGNVVNDLRIYNALQSGIELDTMMTVSDFNIFNDLFINGSVYEGVRVEGNNNMIDGALLYNTGFASINESFYASYSPLRYNGKDYPILIYYNITGASIINVINDDTEIPYANGINNFSMWLFSMPSGNYTVIYEEPMIVANCSFYAGIYNGTCDFNFTGYLLGNGSGNDYIVNRPSNVSIITGGTNPEYLRFISDNIHIFSPILLAGNNNRVTNSIVYNSSNTTLFYSIIMSGNNNNVWRNHFYYATLSNIGIGNSVCQSNIGNFYEEDLTPLSGDCGQATFTSEGTIYNDETTYRAEWNPQDTIAGYPPNYELFLDGEPVGNTTNRYYVVPLAGVNRSYNHNLTLVPWINGSRINGTNTLKVLRFSSESTEYSVIRDDLLYILVAFSLVVVLIAAIIIFLLVSTGTIEVTAILSTVIALATGFAVLITLLYVILTNTII